MNKIVVFVEGRSELIFTRELLIQMRPDDIKFECYELRKNLQSTSYNYSSPNPRYEFTLVNVGNDVRIVSAMKDYAENYLKLGYSQIVGLRDIYSEEYRNLTNKPDKKFIQTVIDNHNKSIRDLGYGSKTKIFFAIMELESWYLAFYQIFLRLDRTLTISKIKSILGCDLSIVDPEKEFYKPSEQVKLLFNVRGKKYKKSEGDTNAIVAKMQLGDINSALTRGVVNSFKDYFQHLKLLVGK